MSSPAGRTAPGTASDPASAYHSHAQCPGPTPMYTGGRGEPPPTSSGRPVHTSHAMSKFELSKLISQRADELLEQQATPLVELKGCVCALSIAVRELVEGKLDDRVIDRPLIDGRIEPVAVGQLILPDRKMLWQELSPDTRM